MLKYLIVINIFLFSAFSVYAFVAESNSYRLELDSLNVGGLYSTSGNFAVEDTVGEIATGFSSSNTYNLKAGYQQMGDGFLALSGPTAVSLSPSLVGTVGGVSNGQATFKVTTDNSAGYSLRVQSLNTPALSSGANSFSDYSPVGSEPDFLFSVGSSQSVFAFSLLGLDVDDRYLDNGTVCGVGALNSNERCWDGFGSSPQIIAGNTGPNVPGGEDTTLLLRAAIGSNKNQASGNYSATIIITAIPL